MNRSTFLFLGFCCLGLLAANVGCQQSAESGIQGAGHGHDHDHDHSERPKNLKAAIAELKEMRDAIWSAMDENDTESAHEPLHEVGNLLKAMPDLAADTDLPESEWDAIKSEVDRLFDAFSDIDSAFHKQDGDKQAAYDAAKSTVEEGVAALEAYLPKLGDGDTTATHDHHDHHEHDEHEEHEEHEEHDDEESQQEASE